MREYSVYLYIPSVPVSSHALLRATYFYKHGKVLTVSADILY